MKRREYVEGLMGCRHVHIHNVAFPALMAAFSPRALLGCGRHATRWGAGKFSLRVYFSRSFFSRRNQRLLAVHTIRCYFKIFYHSLWTDLH